MTHDQPHERNLRLTLSFDGDGFQGYQRQPHAPTIEGCLLEAWKTLTHSEIQLISCSRLDTGVCADHFVANLHTTVSLTCEQIVRGLNGILHHNLRARICIYDVADVAPDFHARFHAKGKHYRYLIWHGRSRHAQFTRNAWHLRKREINFELGPIVAAFEGTHDFSAFRSQDCQAASTIRTIDRAHFWRHSRWPELGVVDFWGRGFLKNMIRNLVGTAVDVAGGELTEHDIRDAFAHGDRTRMGPCAPGYALRLKQVYYDEAKYLEDAGGDLLQGNDELAL